MIWCVYIVGVVHVVAQQLALSLLFVSYSLEQQSGYWETWHGPPTFTRPTFCGHLVPTSVIIVRITSRPLALVPGDSGNRVGEARPRLIYLKS
jgi:hypothetical protein